jgi:hypothetical protein
MALHVGVTFHNIVFMESDNYTHICHRFLYGWIITSACVIMSYHHLANLLEKKQLFESQIVIPFFVV